MKTYTVTEYNAQDLKDLENMTIDDVISWLEVIKRGYLPRSCIVRIDKNKNYTEREYEATRLHTALQKAINMLKSKE